ncbi:MAG: hypothetical protein ACI4DV_04040 [Lachnospiraceae bacterium]
MKIRKSNYLPGILGAGCLILLCVFFSSGFRTGRVTAGKSKICRYDNLKVVIPKPETVTEEDAVRVVQTLLEDSDVLWTEEVCRERTEGNCSSLEELQVYVYEAMQEEVRYEILNAKRKGVLREILKASGWKESPADQEESVLLEIFEAEGMELSEDEISRGLENLQGVYGVETPAELEEFLTEEDQMDIMKKEKVYEYLLENNTFVFDNSDNGKE